MKKILVFSQRADDFRFGMSLEKELQREVCLVGTIAEAQKIFLEEPSSIVVWDAENPDEFENMVSKLSLPIPPSRLAVVTDKPLLNYPKLFESSVFGYHLVRQYSPLCTEVFSKVLQAGALPKASGLDRFFSGEGDSKVQKLQLTSSIQKKPAVEAIRNFLLKLGTIDRIATQIAGAADELLMNAIFDAPVLQDGTRYRQDTDRNASFELESPVNLAFAESERYAAISISDNFGSLNRSQVLFSLKKDYRKTAFQVRRIGTTAALGIHTIVTSGLSLLYVVRPKLNTEVVLFFPKVKTVVDFHSSFSFFGVIGS